MSTFDGDTSAGEAVDVEERDEGPEDERGAARGQQPARDAPEEGGPDHSGEG